MIINPQIIKAPDGSELVVITRAEYDALISRVNEDEEDVAIFDARMAELREDQATPSPQEADSISRDFVR
jgi:hypothetical protein